MLFKFGTFWKLVAAGFLSWTSWAVLGFEFTILTMLAVIIVLLSQGKHFLV